MCCLPVPTLLNRSTYSAAGKYVDRSWEYLNLSQTHECGNWAWGCAIHRTRIHKWDFPCSALSIGHMWVSLNSHYSCMGASSATSSGLNETHVGGIILTLFMLRIGTSPATSSELMRRMWLALCSQYSCWVWGWVRPPRLDWWDTWGRHYIHIVHVEDVDKLGHLVRTDETHVGDIILTLFMLSMETSSATSSGLMRHMWVALYSHCSCWGLGWVLPPCPDWWDTCGWHYTHIVHVQDWDEFCDLVRTDETHVGGIILTLFMFRMGGRVLPPRPDWWDTCGWNYTHIVHVEDGDEFGHLVQTDETHVGGIILTLFMLRMGTSSATSSGLMKRMGAGLWPCRDSVYLNIIFII